MAGLFPPTASAKGVCRLLDPGAGIGSLSSAFLERCSSGNLHFEKVELSAFEFDSLLHEELTNTLASYSERLPLTYDVLGGDFIEEAVNRIQFSYGNDFTHTILNPPYKKINSKSRYRLLLRQAAIETVNLYSAFVALALALMSLGGQLEPLSRVASVMARTTARSASSCWSEQQFGICTYSRRETRLSRMMMCCKRTSSSCLSAEAGKAM